MGTRIRENHAEFLSKFVFCYPDLRDFYLIRYFTHLTKGTNSRLFPVCECGEANSPQHGANQCKLRLKDRDEILSKFKAIFNYYNLQVDNPESLYDYLMQTYYTVGWYMQKKHITELVKLLKETVTKLVRCSSSGETDSEGGND